MDPYGDYSDLPQFHPGMEYRGPPPPVYYVYDHRAAMPMRAYEPIIPHENDILMGRGGKNNQHVGNEKLRKLARKDAKEYCTSSKKGKSNIARGLVMKVRQMQPSGRFLKRNPITSEWEDVGNEYAREKASQVLRDAVALLPESDTAADTATVATEDDRSDNGTAADPDDAPDLSPEASPKYDKKPAARRQKRKAESPLEYERPTIFHHPPAPRSWHFQSTAATLSPPTPVRPVLTPPPMKRMFSGSIFERSAFFTSGPNRDEPNPAVSNNSSSNNSIVPPPLSPFLNRQESLCLSLGAASLPGEGFLLRDSDHARIPTEFTTRTPPSDSNADDEFVSDFY
ncbi:Nitrilase family, member 2 [Seminavis robusta]|uniref:Nitrilase family, member 2 n=1 Tax=Seminavis robusta TaxID=568900 RepID=A0A9N8HSV2_9STRA|nr:Nitrilase family, member 2 [Seminavis robusta]|eukprot:Sro1432_g272150.1 Nitrilase family, member 2 (341) ;mRNA; f:23230-24522